MSAPDDSGCCGAPDAAGAEPVNRPGQPALHWRVATHGRLLPRQLHALARQPALEALSARGSDDPAVALLDAWAAVLDVLAFYQERIANEGFLRTATERRSVQELARSIGYELRPGVAASTYLAFELDAAPGAPAMTRIDAGTRAQSVPMQDEQAQVFETVETVQAQVAWNALALVQEEPAPPRWGGTTLYLRGQANRLQAGDLLLVVGDERAAEAGSENWDLRRISRVLTVPPAQPSADPLAGSTVVTLDRPLGSAEPHVEPARKNPRCHVLRSQAALFGHNAPDWRAMPAALRANYQGLDQPGDALISAQGQWPGFTLADISDPPGEALPGTGLLGEYFSGVQFNRRAFSRHDAVIDFDWGTGAPDPRLGGDHFAVRWTGWVLAPQSGAWTFHLRVDDGARLWVDGQLVIDQWTEHAPQEFASRPVRLAAGRKADLRLEYFERGGTAACRLSWEGPGTARAVVPAAALYPRDVHAVHLDAPHPKWVAGSWVVLAIPEYQELYRVEAGTEDARARFTLTAKTTRLTLRGENLRELFNERLRDTAVFGESQELAWGRRPLSGLVQGKLLDLDTLQPGLPAGRWLAVSGSVLGAAAAGSAGGQRLQRGEALAALEIARDGLSVTATFTDGSRHLLAIEPRAELVRLHAAQPLGGRTRLQLDAPLVHAYLPLTVRINANLAAATHGDSKQMAVLPEVLGSGDGALGFQRFVLKQPPLTHVAARTPSGSASTLALRVDGVLWREAATLSELGPQEPAYLLRLGEDGRTTVLFGDGVHGARLPTGPMNVSARYRVGLGRAGNLPAQRISLLLTRPLGVKEVSNPVPAAGGADAETGERARRNAPLTVLTGGRIVSLRDFEDFAAAFAGIGKAQAVSIWDGQQRLAHVTVSGIDGLALDPASALLGDLQAAMDAVRPAHPPLRLAAGRPLRFGLHANLRLDPRREREPVLAAVRAALAQAFGFEARSFGQSLAGSEVLAVIQRVAGVDWVDLDLLQADDGSQRLVARGPDGRLQARRAHWSGERIAPGELLLIDSAAVRLEEISQ